MNIHPLFVHFPIALLSVYSVLEIGAYMVPRLRQQTWLVSVKTFLLFTGVLAAFAALVTGKMARELIEGAVRSDTFEVHASFAAATTLLYLILAAAYLVRIFDTTGWGDRIVGTNKFMMWSWNFKERFWGFIMDSWLLPCIALLALAGITVTGALGAAIVYGPDIDPFVSFIYNFF